MSDPEEQTSALDFATHTVFATDRQAEARAEVAETLRELVQSFGAAEVSRGMAEAGLCAPTGAGDDKVLQALRGFAVLIMDDERPKLVAALVGKLAKLEVATGRTLFLEELGRINGVSKQAASKKMAYIARRLGLQRPDSSAKARQSHRLMNRRNYAHRTDLPA